MAHLLGGGLSQFWPDFLPVIWAKVTAGYGSSGGALDCEAVLNWHGASAAAPLMHDGWSHLNGLGETGLRAHALTGLLNGLLICHAPNFSIAKAKTQAMLNHAANSIAI